MIGLCADESVNGAPFYVMAFVDGLVVRNAEAAAPARRRGPGARRPTRSPTSWPRIHAVDPDGGRAGRPGPHRRLHRAPAQALVQAVGEVQDPRAARGRRGARRASPPGSPSRAGAAIVHGDYRLDNCMLGPDGTIGAVLDWELCTLGDPLADVGLLLVYWTEPRRQPRGSARRRHHARGLPDPGRGDRHATPRRRDGTCPTSTTTWPSATGSWPASSRACTPATGAAPWASASGFEGFARQVEMLADQAKAAIEGRRSRP